MINSSNLKTHSPSLLTKECQLGVEHPSKVFSTGKAHLTLEYYTDYRWITMNVLESACLHSNL